MGEVCRARDTKLGHEVTIKVLPEAFACLQYRLIWGDWKWQEPRLQWSKMWA